MKIAINFNQNTLAKDFYLKNKSLLLKSIKEFLKESENPVTPGSKFQILTDSRHFNIHSIKSLNFIVDNVSVLIINKVSVQYIKLSLVNLEN